MDETVAEARERLRTVVTTGMRDGWGGLWYAATDLLLALDREDAARRAHAERVADGECCVALLVVDGSERGRLEFDNAHVTVSTGLGQGFPVGWDVLISRRYSGKWPSMAALRTVADGECCDVPEEAGP